MIIAPKIRNSVMREKQVIIMAESGGRIIRKHNLNGREKKSDYFSSKIKFKNPLSIVIDSFVFGKSKLHILWEENRVAKNQSKGQPINICVCLCEEKMDMIINSGIYPMTTDYTTEI